MTENSEEMTEISISDNFDVAVNANGVRVEISKSGEVVVYKDGKAAEFQTKRKDARPEIGTKMPDGTIYAGISPDTHKHMFVSALDDEGLHTIEKARSWAEVLDKNGHNDWRVPSTGELRLLFQNRAAIGGFQFGSYYQARDPDIPSLSAGLSFISGERTSQVHEGRLRCVRG